MMRAQEETIRNPLGCTLGVAGRSAKPQGPEGDHL